MKWFTFVVLVFGFYFIYRWARKAWMKADVADRMDTTLFVEDQHAKVEEFKEEHGNPKEKEKDLKNFVKNKY
ncbi:MAG: hypothetical protein R3213_01950 [Flavobacteriaceae bacterium]|nr:hypothetical protein [Flavobacteriaceae bacterium]